MDRIHLIRAAIRKITLSCVTCLLAAGPWALPPSALARDLIIQAGTLLDGTGGPSRHEVSIVVRGERIADIRPGFVSEADAQTIDLRHSTVMPGFIDCHVHMASRLPGKGNALEYELTHSVIDRAFDGAVFARAMLQQGFTAARDLGGGDDTVALKRAIDEGKVEGPRLWVALEPLSPTGGHGDMHNGMDPAVSDRAWDRGIVDTPEEGRLRVREHRRRGATVIKILPSGGIASRGDDPRAQTMTDEEISAIVATAHSLGLKVAAHVYPANAIKAAVRGGVDSIEHGSFADDAALKLMKEKGVVLVPTLTVYDVFYEAASRHPEYLDAPEKELENDLLPKRNLPRAVASGVRIAYGTDIGEGDHATEFRLLTQNGMTPAAALTAATRTAAELLGAEDRIGTIATGRYADLVATDGNPLEDVSQFSKVTFVMKGGRLYRSQGKPVVP